MKSRSFLSSMTSILSFLFFRLVFPLVLDIWFTAVLGLNGWLSLLFSIFWYIAPIFCTPFWIYAFFFVAPVSSFSTWAFIFALVYIFNRPFCILPGTIPLLSVRWLGSKSLGSRGGYWMLPPAFPDSDSYKSKGMIQNCIHFLEADLNDCKQIASDSSVNEYVRRGCSFSITEYQAIINIFKELVLCFEPHEFDSFFELSIENHHRACVVTEKLQKVLFQMGSLYHSYRYVDKFPFRSVHAEYIDNAIKRLYPSVYMYISELKDIYK